jgi:hypothetical protein
MASSIPSSITCFSTGLSHLVFPITMPPGQPQVRVGPLTNSTVSGSIALLPKDPAALTIRSISSVDCPGSSQMLRVQYKIAEGTNAPTMANLSYLTEGITWEPSYILMINSVSKTLRLTGRATILSNLPFLDDCSVPSLSLVSGDPSIVCKGKVDSLVTGGRGGVGGGHPPKMHMEKKQMACDRGRIRKYEYSEIRESEEGDLSGHSVASFFHYNIKNVPFNHQLPTSMAFMEDVTDVSFKNIYKIKLEASKAEGSNVPTKHYLEFPTSCSSPLPRGPVMVLVSREDEDQEDLLAQAWLQSEPDAFSLYITDSREVLVKFAISSTGQKIVKKEEKKDKYSKDRILLETSKSGKITVSNRKKEEVNVEIKHLLQGHLITSHHNCSDTLEIQNDQMNPLNPENLYTWMIVVPAGGKEEIAFEYTLKEWKLDDTD